MRGRVYFPVRWEFRSVPVAPPPGRVFFEQIPTVGKVYYHTRTGQSKKLGPLGPGHGISTGGLRGTHTKSTQAGARSPVGQGTCAWRYRLHCDRSAADIDIFLSLDDSEHPKLQRVRPTGTTGRPAGSVLNLCCALRSRSREVGGWRKKRWKRKKRRGA